MKVKELIKYLKELDQELEVYLSIDDEGNGFYPLSSPPGIYYGEVNGEVNGCFYIDEIMDTDEIIDEFGYATRSLHEPPYSAEEEEEAIEISANDEGFIKIVVI